MRVFRSVEVGDLDGLRHVAHPHERNEYRGLAREQGLDAPDELGGGRQEDGRSAGEVLGLGHEVVGDALRKRAHVGDDEYLARTLGSVHSDIPEYLQLRGGHVVVTGTHDLIHGWDALGAVGHGSHRLGAPDGIDLFEPQETRDGEHVRAYLSVGTRRDADADLSHPRDLCRDRRHDEGAWISAVPTRNVDAGPLHRSHPLTRRRPVAARFERTVQLALVKQANVLHGDAEALLDLWGERNSGHLHLLQGNPNLLEPHPVEVLGVLQERLVSPILYVRDDAPGRVADLLGEEAAGAS